MDLRRGSLSWRPKPFSSWKKGNFTGWRYLLFVVGPFLTVWFRDFPGKPPEGQGGRGWYSERLDTGPVGSFPSFGPFFNLSTTRELCPAPLSPLIDGSSQDLSCPSLSPVLALSSPCLMTRNPLPFANCSFLSSLPFFSFFNS